MTPASLTLFLSAPFVGSFAGVLALRLPERRAVIMGRSACDACHHVLGPLDLIPLASWLASRGRCRHCAARLGPFYPAVELAAVAIPLTAALAVPDSLLFASCVLGWTLLALAVADWRTFTLPDALVAFLALMGFVESLVDDLASLPDRIAGAVAGFAAFFCVSVAYCLLRGRDGLGLGDAKLLGAIGTWVSWRGLPSTVLEAAIIALLFVLVRSLAGLRFTATDKLPFGSYLALGAWFVWLLGPIAFT